MGVRFPALETSSHIRAQCLEKDRMRQLKVLQIVHQSSSDPGRVGQIFNELGFKSDRRCPNLGDPLPATMDDHDAVVIYGGPQSANDTDDPDTPGIRVELDFMPTILQSGKPFLGICLGAQILAKSLGAKVDLHPDGCIEAGYYQIEPTADGEDYFDGPAMFYQWHKEGFDVPAGATLLAQSTMFENQVFRYGKNAYGVQFHPEVLEPVIQRWSTDSPERLKMPGARPAETHLAEFKKFDKDVDVWIRRFIERLVSDRKDSVQVEAAD